MESQSPDDCRIRPGTREDLDLLRAMLLAAVYWRPGSAPASPLRTLERPELAKLLAGWGRPGDTAAVADTPDGRTLGAAWYRFWTDEDHSYGFVDSRTPEVAIGVRPGMRGRGVGTRLLRALIREARASGVTRLSLSVERDNPALSLYRRLGFVVVGEVDAADTMLLELASERAPRSAPERT